MNGPPPWVSFIKGKDPLVLTCGHDGAGAPPWVPERSGFTPRFSAQRDINTRAVSLEIVKELEAGGIYPTLVLAEFHRRYIDVNRPPAEAYEVPSARRYFDSYHRAVAAACPRYKNCLIFDIHGTSIGTSDVFLGDRFGESAPPILTDTFASLLESQGLKIDINHPRLSGGWTCLLHSWQRPTSVIQIEIARRWRDSPESIKKIGAALGVSITALIKPQERDSKAAIFREAAL